MSAAASSDAMRLLAAATVQLQPLYSLLSYLAIVCPRSVLSKGCKKGATSYFGGGCGWSCSS
jgi:hypothetical protein